MSTLSQAESMKLDNVHVAGLTPLVTPKALKERFPRSGIASETVFSGRKTIQDILAGRDSRFLVIVGPCSIHDPQLAYDYAERLKGLAEEVSETLFIVMRTYFEKPRTTVGWKGLISDPHLDGSNDMITGLMKAREVLLTVSEMGLPTATEMLDPIVPQYISDLVAWASIGARTTESQTHREMASGLSMPVGFKNSTDGNLMVAINAMLSAQNPHHFLGIDQEGRTCVVETRGNKDGHLILRGGGGRANYDAVSVALAREQLTSAKLPERILVDCSHANSNKDPENQPAVLDDVIGQRLGGVRPLLGVMMESHIEGGRQDIPEDRSTMKYGVSVTDPCLGWDATASALRAAHGRLRKG